MNGKKILVVEDEHIVAMGIKRMLIREQAEKTGAFGYITKRFDENDLAGSIETALKNHELVRKSSEGKILHEVIISLPVEIIHGSNSFHWVVFQASVKTLKRSSRTGISFPF